MINNFNLLSSRGDTGALWENLAISERLKYQTYYKIRAENYFWKTYDGAEVDLVEAKEEKLHGFEIKWGKDRGKRKISAKWKEERPSSFKVINPETIKGFIL